MSLLTALFIWLQILLGLDPSCKVPIDASTTPPPSCSTTPEKTNAPGLHSPTQINNGF